MTVAADDHDQARGRFSFRRGLEESVDRLAGSDPGLNRLRLAIQALLTIILAMVGVRAFVGLTGALVIHAPAGAPPAVVAAAAAGSHDLLIIGILLAGLCAMQVTLGVTEGDLARQYASVVVVGAAMVAALAFGLAIAPYRVAALSSFPLILALGTMARRWGQRGAAVGYPLFLGDFMGYLLRADIHFRDLGWLAAELAIAVLASIVVRATLFRPDPGAALLRAQRSFAARATGIARRARELFETDPDQSVERLAHRLQRQRVRLNEAALMIDAHLVDVADGSSAQQLQERLFDAELSLTNTARFAEALRLQDLDPADRADVGAALAALADRRFEEAGRRADAIAARLRERALQELGPPATGLVVPHRRRRVLLHRFASSVTLAAESVDAWMDLGEASARQGERCFTPAVRLIGGWLPGSSQVSATASNRPGQRGLERWALPPWLRVAIQVGVAVAVATAVGDVISGHRFYWAVIAAFVSFVGTNNTFEQVNKAALRILGTVVGLVLGSLVVDLIGPSEIWALIVILVAMFLGIYLIRVNYAFMVLGVTVMVTELYEQLGELTRSLLLLRLAETTVGAAITVLTVLLVLPLRTQRVLVVAVGELLAACDEVVSVALGPLGALLGTERVGAEQVGGGPADGDGAGRSGAASLAEAGRAVDAAYQALVTTARPLRRIGDTGRWSQRIVSAASGLRHYSRNLAMDAPGVVAIQDDERLIARRAAAQLGRSFDAVERAFADRDPDRDGDGDGDGDSGRFVRSASRWSELEQLALDRMRVGVASEPAVYLPRDPVSLVLVARDLQLVDGALADLAATAGLSVVGLDTSDPADGGQHRLTEGSTGC